MRRPPDACAPRGLGRGPRAAAVLALAGFVAAGGCGGNDERTAAGPSDPDSIPDAYARPTAALMWPGASRAFQVTPRGDLYNGEWTVRIRAGSNGIEAAPPRRIASEERWRPPLRWRRHGDPVAWDFEAVALPGPAPRDSGLVVSLVVRATNRGDGPCEARLALRFEPPDSIPAFAAFDAPVPPGGGWRWAGTGTGGPVAGWTTLPASGDSCVSSWTLAPRATRAARFVLPAYPAPARALAAWARRSHAARADEARRFWTRAILEGAAFGLGDPGTERALAAARVVLLSCRERRGPLWVPIGNPFQYRDVWLRDGARAIHALAVSGHTREARALAEGFTRFQWPQGAFLSQRGQLDGTGQALWAFEQAMLRPAPDDSVGRYAEAALRAWGWYEWQRGLGRRSGWTFGPMLPFAEPRDAELVRAQLVGNDAWALAGYRATARLLRAAHRAAEAESVEASLARYRSDFARALADAGGPDVPASWQLVGRDWGNLAAAYPCGALAPDDPRCVALARRVWAAAGGAGMLWYGTRDSLQYYVGADLGTWALLTGCRAQADSVLEAMLTARNASGGAGEIFTRGVRDYGVNLPPHATSAAALIELVRNALVFDEADTLALTLGARARWWNGSRLARAPTRWGLLDLEFARRDSTAEWRWTPVPVWTALALPPGTRLAAEPRPPLLRGARADVVLAPPGTREARVALAAAGRAP